MFGLLILPGAGPIHCHQNTHAGLGRDFIVGVSKGMKEINTVGKSFLFKPLGFSEKKINCSFSGGEK